MALCAAPRVTSHHPYDGGVVPTAADNNIDDAVVDDVGVGDTKLGESSLTTMRVDCDVQRHSAMAPNPLADAAAGGHQGVDEEGVVAKAYANVRFIPHQQQASCVFEIS
jgi:hypothetical protein